jgi:hypothetical protein
MDNYAFDVNEQEPSSVEGNAMIGVMSIPGSTKRRPRTIGSRRTLRRSQSASTIEFEHYRSRGIPFNPQTPSPFPHMPFPTPSSPSPLRQDTSESQRMDIDLDDLDFPDQTVTPGPAPRGITSAPAQSSLNPHSPHLRVLEKIREEGLSFGDFVAEVTNRENRSFEWIQNGFYRSDSRSFLRVLDNLHTYGASRFNLWMETHALSMARQKVSDEFLAVSPSMYVPVAPETGRIDRSFLTNWSVKQMFGLGLGNELKTRMPWWGAILDAATTTKRNTQENRIRDPSLVCDCIDLICLLLIIVF